MSTPDTLMTGDALAQLCAQFAGQAADNPAMAMLMQWFDQRQTAAAAPAMADRPDEDIAESCPARHDGLDHATRADVRTLLAHSEAQEAELTTLRERNDLLAAALGACHLCFGDDAWCPHCGGRGRPGSRRPAPGPFKRYLRPLLDRLRPAAPVDDGAASVAPLRSPVSPMPMGGSGNATR